MDDDALNGRNHTHKGRSLGDFEELVGHDNGNGGPTPGVRKLWNPVTYRCAFCGESFVSQAMIRRHLKRHAPANDEAKERAA